MSHVGAVHARPASARDLAAAAREIGAAVPTDLPDRLDGFLQFRHRRPRRSIPTRSRGSAGRSSRPTTTRRPPRIIGSVGFHAPPGPDGRVEVGYRVEPEYRRQGVATEAVAALFDWAAREHGVTRFRASVAPGQRRLAGGRWPRFGFRQTGVQIDDIDGEELVFELDGWPPTT